VGERYSRSDWEYATSKVREMQDRIKAAKSRGQRDAAAEQGLKYWQRFVRGMSQTAQ
jgi:hypothetical protein